MITVDFLDRARYVTEEEMETIDSLINFTYDYLKKDDTAEVSVSFVSDSEIKEINSDYRNNDEITDVISFAFMDNDDIVLPGMPMTLGDIIINTNRAERQAKEYGHSYKRELLFLSLHGFLHLLGYDHMTEEEEQIMFSLQKEILEKFGIPRN